VLRSSIREFLCSEAMYYLSIPTTRAGTVITSESVVERDPFYDGNAVMENCTIVSRIAENFFRFGSFEIFKGKDVSEGEEYARSGPSAGNEAIKRQFFEYLLLYFPEISSQSNLSLEQKSELYFQWIVERTAKLIALWQAYGFVHGVMNTDNLSVMGVTIDYGPFGFMEFFDKDFVPNGSDNSGRYAYCKQPAIGKWDLLKFSEVLFPILSKEKAEQLLSQYDTIYEREYLTLMRMKLGFLSEDNTDQQFFEEYFKVMSLTFTDFSDSFVAFTEFIEEVAATTSSNYNDSAAVDHLLEKLLYKCARPSSIINLLKRKLRIHRLTMDPRQIQQLYSLFETNNTGLLRSLFRDGVPLDVIRDQITTEKLKLDLLVQISQDMEKYKTTSDETKKSHDKDLWKAFIVDHYLPRLQKEKPTVDGTSGEGDTARLANMRKVNPTIVLRNWMAQKAIEDAEKNDFTGVRVLLALLSNPYDYNNSIFCQTLSGVCPMKKSNGDAKAEKGQDPEEVKKNEFLKAPPEWADSLLCTCSS
jgi:uncharacterized protein YdiU (UPF0061 family)